MRSIVLEGSKISSDIASGISNYTVNLFRNIKENENRFGFDCHLLLWGRVPTHNIYFRDTEVWSSAFRVKKLLGFIKMLTLGLSEKNDIFHSPYMFLPPRRNDSINLLTIHDTINLERTAGIRNTFREKMLRLAIQRADYFICISNVTKDKLKMHFPLLDDDKIFVVYQGIDQSFFLPVVSNAFDNLAKASPYLLYVGQRHHYKNFDSLIKYMAASPTATGLQVLCVGGGPFSTEEKKRLHNLNLTKKILHVGYTTVEDLKYLYRHAKALLYTSLHEGFGLPIIEAMAQECPVICGNFSSMKEISGGKSILLNDFSITSIEDAISRVEKMTSEELAAAKIHAAQFTWETTSLNTMKIYSLLAQTKIPRVISNKPF